MVDVLGSDICLLDYFSCLRKHVRTYVTMSRCVIKYRVDSGQKKGHV